MEALEGLYDASDFAKPNPVILTQTAPVVKRMAHKKY